MIQGLSNWAGVDNQSANSILHDEWKSASSWGVAFTSSVSGLSSWALGDGSHTLLLSWVIDSWGIASWSVDTVAISILSLSDWACGCGSLTLAIGIKGLSGWASVVRLAVAIGILSLSNWALSCGLFALSSG